MRLLPVPASASLPVQNAALSPTFANRRSYATRRIARNASDGETRASWYGRPATQSAEVEAEDDEEEELEEPESDLLAEPLSLEELLADESLLLPASPPALSLLPLEPESSDPAPFLRFLSLKSVSYQPDPFNRKLGADSSFLSAALPHFGQIVSGSSLSFWIVSNWWSQSVQLYSYIGMMHDFGRNRAGILGNGRASSSVPRFHPPLRDTP